jgi:rare lipoprotein A
MRKYCIIFLIVILSACVKQPDTHRHYAQKRNPQTHASLFDFFFSNSGKRSSYKGPNSYTVHGRTYKTMKSSAGYREKGTATWYGKNFHNQRTSSGERYNMYAMTAAHRTLPLHSYVKVTNIKNRRSVVVRINDRGPFHSSRLIDLSYAAARGIGLLSAGMAQVEIQTTSPQKIQRTTPKPILKKAQKRTIRHAAPIKKRPHQMHKPASRKNQKRIIRHAVPVKKRQQHMRKAVIRHPVPIKKHRG